MCPNMSIDNHLFTLSAPPWPPVTAPAQFRAGQWPFPSTLHPWEHVEWLSSSQAGVPEAAGQKGAGGQTDTVWDGQTLLADTGRGWSYCCVPLAPWHIWVFHLWISLLHHPARVGLLCLWGRWRNSGSSEGEGNYCAVIRNRNVLQHIYMLYTIYSMSYII